MPGPELKKPWQMLNVLGVILGGGRGTRLYPLTRDRAKPAVPLLGQYRLIDIPISNCLNSGINRMYALTQFNSESLLRHIANTYKFDVFSDSWVEVLPAQQTHSDDDWYQGTADAVRQNLHFIAEQDMPHVLILSGDQLYRMDYRLLLETHLRNEADVTISCLPVSKQEAQEFGIVRAGRNNHVTDFAEKPAPENLDERFQLRGNSCAHAQGGEEESASYLASMGIYLFNIEALMSALESYSDCDDFGAGIIPRCVQEMDVRAHFFDDYWEDIGTIESFYRANLLMTDHEPAFNFYVENAPVYTHPRFLPPPKVTDCSIVRSLIGAGSRVNAERVENSVVGLRSRIGSGSVVRRSIIMGQDFYESDHQEMCHSQEGRPPVGIGSDCVVENCILDKNVRVGAGVRIKGMELSQNIDTDLYSVRNGIVVIPKNTSIPPGTDLGC